MLLGCLRYLLVLLPALFIIRIPSVGWKWLLLYGFISNFSQFAFMFSAIATGMPTGLVALVVQSQAFYCHDCSIFYANKPFGTSGWLSRLPLWA